MNEKKLHWKFQFIRPYDGSEEHLESLDIIRINYPQYKGELCTDISYNMKNPE